MSTRSTSCFGVFEAVRAASGGLRSAVARVGEPKVLLLSVALALLTLLWWTTLHLLSVETAAAESAALASSRELAETYEAQIVRALNEIDQALKVVKFTYEHGERRDPLADLKSRSLLPPDLLFVVTIVDIEGRVVASTRPAEMDAAEIRQDLLVLRLDDDFHIGQVVEATRERKASRPLRFGRRLDDARGQFAGAVMITVDAEYFVSGYEESRLGKFGFIGLLDPGGAFRARRSGDTADAGGGARYGGLVPKNDSDASDDGAVLNAWDGVRRYTSTRILYGFPLAVVVGLSEAEQLAAARRRGTADVCWAAVGSLVTLMIIAVLARLNGQLARSRRRVTDDQVEHALQVRNLALHDGLTGLPNRTLFSELLRASVDRASRLNGQVAILYFDLDAFRPVNDSFGHAAGDLVLIETALRLQRSAGAKSAVARVGGDEFLLLLEGIGSTDDATAMALNLVDAFRAPFDVLGHTVHLSACIGIAMYPAHGKSDELVVNADAAMYTAKRSGAGGHAVFDSAMAGRALEQLNVLNHLRHAVTLDQLALHYQPKIDCASGRMCGVEALLRWRHPALGAVNPEVFIPLAERFGLIHELGNWVIAEACRQMRVWGESDQRVKVAINVSAHQLRRNDLVARIAQALESNGLQPSQLLVEITESVMMEDIKTTQTIFTGLARLGVFLSIDDFGTGHSSLSYLRQLPATQLKIDRSFISDLEASADARAIVDAVIRLAHALDLRVVAEGVETAGQRQILLDLGCDELQGYYFARPMTALGLIDWLRNIQPNEALALT